MSSSWSSISSTASTGLPVPRPTEISQPHWDGCAQGRLLIQRCHACERLTFPPQMACEHCFGEALEWIECSGRGTVYSHTVVHRPQRPEFDAPYVVAIIELEEGCHLLSNLVDCDPAHVTIGAPVVVHFVARGEITLPMFRLRG
jgi:uncharacterized protein